jgi:serine/threonine protein kinase
MTTSSSLAAYDLTDIIEPTSKKFPSDAEQYELIHEIGTGARSKVYRAVCKALNEEVAIKIIDLEQFPSGVLEDITVRFCALPIDSFITTERNQYYELLFTSQRCKILYVLYFGHKLVYCDGAS